MSVVVATEDRLRAENLTLKLENVQARMQSIQSEIQRLLESRNTIVGDMNKLKDEFIQKYGIDLTKVAIMPDGTVQELPAAKTGAA